MPVTMALVAPAASSLQSALSDDENQEACAQPKAHSLPDAVGSRQSSAAVQVVRKVSQHLSVATRQVVRLAGHPLHILLDAKSFMSYAAATFFQFWSGVLAIALIVAWGGLVFAHLETRHTDEANSTYATFMFQLQVELNSTSAGSALYSTLVENYIADPTTLRNAWLWDSFRVFLFSFELITTIGYGEVAPKTLGGRLWLCLYSIVCIPVTGLSLTAISSVLLSNLEMCILIADPMPRKIWRRSKANEVEASPANKSSVSVVHVRAALEQQTATAYDVDEFESHLAAASVSRHYGVEQRLTYWQFLRLFASFESDNSVTAARHRRRRLAVALCVVALWLMMGMFSFNHYEQWGYVPSLYFSFVTLATIGLGDYYPDTRHGVAFLFFFSVTGIGLVAVLLSCVADVWQHVNNTTVEVVTASKRLQSEPLASDTSVELSDPMAATVEVQPVAASDSSASDADILNPPAKEALLSMRVGLPGVEAAALGSSINALLKACLTMGLVVRGAQVNAPVFGSESAGVAATEVVLQFETTDMAVVRDPSQLAHQMRELLALRGGTLLKAVRQNSGQKGMRGAKFARVGNR